MIINSTPRHKRNDLLPTMVLQTLAIADLKMPKNMVRKLDEGHIKEVAHGIQAMGFSVPVLVGKLAVANLVTIGLQAGNSCHNRFKQRLTFNKRQGCGVAAIEMQKVEGVKDQAYGARPIGRGLGLSEVRKAVLADPAQFAVEIGVFARTAARAVSRLVICRSSRGRCASEALPGRVQSAPPFGNRRV
jgi:hypothetical protein